MTKLQSGGLLFLSLGGFILPGVGCDTSVTVQSQSSTPGVASSVANVPGTTDPIAEPTQLDGDRCDEPSNPRITLNYYDAFARFPLSGNDFVTFWTVCNQGRQPQPSGQSYTFNVVQQTVNTQNGTIAATTTLGSQSIPIPALAPCTCYVQEVGINMTPDSSLAQQPAIVGLSAVFPTIAVGATPPPDLQSHTAFEDLPSLTSVPSGVPAPQVSFTFNIN